MSEVWKKFPEATEYEVSTHGRVRKKWRIKKLSPQKNGYLKTWIRGKLFRVHRLVALTFLADTRRPWLKVVDHIDQDKTNNHVSNLRWTSQAVNHFNSEKTKGYCKRRERFRVYQRFMGKLKHHGYFKHESEAKELADQLKASKIEALLAAYETIDTVIENAVLCANVSAAKLN